MNLVMHIFKKDFRRLRGLMLLWILLLAAQLGLSVSGLEVSTGSMAWEAAFRALGQLIPWLQMLVAFLLVPLLIQSEPLVGTTAYWYTRPITSRQLLVAKGMFCLGILVLLPAIAELIVLAANQATIRQLGLALTEILLERSFNLFILAALAALTPNFTRFVLISVLIYVLYMLSHYAISIAGVFIDPLALAARFSDTSLALSRVIAAKVLVIAGCGVALVHQYLRRAKPVSALAFSLSLLAYMALPYVWSLDFMRPGVPEKLAGHYDASGAKFLLQDGKLSVSDQFRMNRNKESRQKRIQGFLAAEGALPGYELRPAIEDGTFTFEDGFQARLPKSQFKFDINSWNKASLQRLMGDFRTPESTFPRFHITDIFTLSDDDYKARLSQRGRLDAKLNVEVFRYEMAGETPLKAGGQIKIGAEQVAIMDVLEEDNGFAVILRERSLNLQFDRAKQSSGSLHARNRNVLYVLRNNERKEFLIPEIDFASGFGGSLVFRSKKRLNMESFRLDYKLNLRGMDDTQLYKEWLAGAELVRIEAIKVDQFEANMAMDGLSLKSSSPHRLQTTKTREQVSAELAKIELPDNPTEEETRQYVRAIAKASEGLNSFSSNDRQIAMLQKIHPRYLHMIFQELPEGSFHLQYATLPMAGEANKDWIIYHLYDYPWLVEAVWKNEWVEDARDQLLRVFREKRSELRSGGYMPGNSWNQPDVWLLAVASLDDPATYDDLVYYFVNERKRYENYRVIKELDQIDLDQAVARAWKVAKFEDTQEMMRMIPIAISHGEIDALRAGILDVLNGHQKEQHLVEPIRNAVWHYSGQRGSSDAELATWFRANAAKLTFDRDAGLFRSGKTTESTRAETSKTVTGFHEPVADRLKGLALTSNQYDLHKSKEEINAELDKISYPENPTVEDVRKYIRAIANATRGQNSWSNSDRQIPMLQRVGPEYLHVLFEEIPDSYHLYYAALPLVSESNKDWVINNLAKFPWLVEAVWKNNWVADARDVLISGIQNKRNPWDAFSGDDWHRPWTHKSLNQPDLWLVSAASLQDPSTYDDLINYFAYQKRRDQNYRVISELPGIDLDAAVAMAWQNARYDHEFEMLRFIPIAIAHGHLDALSTGILDVLADPEKRDHLRDPVRVAIKKHTGIMGTDDELVAWYRTNSGNLKFNSKERLYRVGADNVYTARGGSLPEQSTTIEREKLADKLRSISSTSSGTNKNKTEEEVALALDQIRYPLEPKEVELRQYVRAIFDASMNQGGSSSNDRQVTMLRRVGPENVRILFEEFAKYNQVQQVHLRMYLEYATKPLVGKKDRELIIKYLKEYPFLIDAVVKYNWTSDARELLMQGIREQWPVSGKWFVAVASFRDPLTYNDLGEFFVKNGYEQIYEALKEIDGIDLDALVARAWQNAKFENEYSMRNMIPIAIAHGHKDALRLGILEAESNPDERDHHIKQIRKALEVHTDFSGDAKAFAGWFRENESKLVYDRDTEVFRVGEP